MRRALIVLFLLATPVFAIETADLYVSIEAPPHAERGVPYTFRGIVTNHGPDVATGVTMSLIVLNRVDCFTDEPLGDLAPGQSRALDCSYTVPATGELPNYQLDLFASAGSATSDPAVHDNVDYERIDIVTPPDLVVVLPYVSAPTPALSFTAYVRYLNRAHTAAGSATITIDSSVPFVSVPDFCTVTGQRAVCNIGAVAAGSDQTFEVTLLAAPEWRQTMTLAATIEPVENDAAPSNNRATATIETVRGFEVTTNADSGPGSLRAAIERANAECSDIGPGCEIAFRLPMAGRQWQTIELLTPLPVIEAKWVVIDGTSQTRWSGDTNPLGPEIELRGAKLQAGHGFERRDCDSGFILRGLTINAFPWNGVQIGRLPEPGRTGCPSFATISGNYIGTDPTGTRAVPNGRGIVVDGEFAQFVIEQNVISGNTRSGVFVERGFGKVRENVIGLNAKITAGLGNGASGVYLGPHAMGTDVKRNYIGFNHHFGIAVSPASLYNDLSDNSLQANYGMGIDRGLDGRTDGPLPEITSVRVEDGRTIIEGISNHRPTIARSFVYVYANDAPDPSGYGEGQYTLGSVTLDGPTFRLVYPQDLRGKWITATLTQMDYYGWLQGPRANDSSQGFVSTTSEFSRAVEVR